MEQYFSLIFFVTAMTITPGPNTIMLTASGLNFGIKRSIPHFLGICFGFPIMLIAIGFGINLALAEHQYLHDTIKILGIIYLLSLSWIIATSTPFGTENKKANPIGFINALLFQWVNPKAWIMATGAISAYTTFSLDSFNQILSIALIFFLVSFPCAGIWLIFGAKLNKHLKSRKQQQVFNISMALLLVFSLLPMVIGIFTKQ